MAVRADGTLAMLAVLMPLVISAACDRSREVQASAPPPAQGAPSPARQPKAPTRTVIAVSGEPIARTLTFESHLMVERDVGVTTRRDGVIESILADRGDRVKENQPLARLERGDLLLNEKTADLELRKEQSSYERAQRLSEQRIMSDEEFEQARLRRDAAEKSLELIRYELEKCVIRAPFDGVISGRFVEKGQVIKEDDAKTLFQVTAMGPLLARVYVPEWALVALKEGQRARITAAASPVGDPADAAQDHEARVRWVNDVLDAASGSVEVLVEMVGGRGAARLKPGMSVQVSLDLSFGGRPSSLVSLAREALGAGEPSPGQHVELEVLRPDGSVERRPVVVGFVGDRCVEVRHGLSAGDRVVLGHDVR